MKAPQFLLAAALVLSAPALAQPQDVFSVSPEGALLTHIESGTQFPAEVAGFTRIGERAFDAHGEYVGVAYQKDLGDGATISLRISLVHIEDMTPREHYLIIRPVILRGLTDVKPIAEGIYDRPGYGADGYIGLFDAIDQGQPVGIALWTFDRGKWDLRGRVEFPQGRQEETQEAVDEFVDAFVALKQPYNTPAEAEAPTEAVKHAP